MGCSAIRWLVKTIFSSNVLTIDAGAIKMLREKLE